MFDPRGPHHPECSCNRCRQVERYVDYIVRSVEYVEARIEDERHENAVLEGR